MRLSRWFSRFRPHVDLTFFHKFIDTYWKPNVVYTLDFYKWLYVLTLTILVICKAALLREQYSALIALLCVIFL